MVLHVAVRLLFPAAVDHMAMGSLRAELLLPPCMALGEDEDEDEHEAEMAILGQGTGSFSKPGGPGGCDALMCMGRLVQQRQGVPG